MEETDQVLPVTNARTTPMWILSFNAFFIVPSISLLNRLPSLRGCPMPFRIMSSLWSLGSHAFNEWMEVVIYHTLHWPLVWLLLFLIRSFRYLWLFYLQPYHNSQFYGFYFPTPQLFRGISGRTWEAGSSLMVLLLSKGPRLHRPLSYVGIGRTHGLKYSYLTPALPCHAMPPLKGV